MYQYKRQEVYVLKSSQIISNPMGVSENWNITIHWFPVFPHLKYDKTCWMKNMLRAHLGKPPHRIG